MIRAEVTQGFAAPPYHVEHFPGGSCVCNRDGFNCLHFPDKPGAKFTTPEIAQQICDCWNSGSKVTSDKEEP